MNVRHKSYDRLKLTREKSLKQYSAFNSDKGNAIIDLYFDFCQLILCFVSIP